MATMTKEDLDKYIGQAVDTLKVEVSKSVAELVKENMAKALEPVAKEQHDWMSRILGSQETEVSRKREKGELFGRYARAIAASAMHAKMGQFIAPEDIAKGWGDADVAKFITDYRSKTMTAGDPLAGGFLVPQQFSQDVVELLRPTSVVRRLGATTIPMPVGSLRFPTVSAGTTGYYVGEATNITKTQLATGQITLTFKKLAAVVPFSNDLLRYSSPGADAIVRDDVVRAFGQAENTAFLRGQGVSAAPKGLRYWAAAANVFAANATVSLANTTIDLGKLMQKLMDNNIPFTRPGWIFAPRTWRYLATIQTTTGAYVFREEMNGGRLWGYPYAISTGIPVNLTDGGGTTETEVYLADFADVIIGEAMSMAVDASSEAAYDDGGTTRLAFSRDETVIRAITEHDLGVRRAESVALLNCCTWGA